MMKINNRENKRRSNLLSEEIFGDILLMKLISLIFSGFWIKFMIGRNIPKLNNSNKNEIKDKNKVNNNPFLKGLTNHNDFKIFVFPFFK